MIKSTIWNIYTRLLYFPTIWKWKHYLKENKDVKLIVGSSKTAFPGWFPTEQYFLDITNEGNFSRLFQDKKFDFLLAEHVLEHIPNEGLERMAKLFYEYSSNKVNIRIAVPDGFHADPEYINNVKPGGTGAGAYDHKNLFTYKSLAAVFEKAGFKSNPVEYWDESHHFHKGYTNDDKGYIQRSMLNDKRNAGGNPVYTSLIMDFYK